MKTSSDEKDFDNSLKLIVKTSFIVFIGLMLSKLLFYGYRIITARYLGPEIYGLLSISMMIIGWFIALSSLGLSDGLLRYISLYRGKNEIKKIKYIFKFSLYSVFSLSILSGLVLFFTSEYISITFFHNTELIIFLKAFSGVVPIAVLFYILLSVIKAYEKIGTYSFILNVLQNFIKLGLLIFFLFIGFKGNAVIFSYIIGTIGVLIAAYWVCRYRISEIWRPSELNNKSKKELKKELLSYSWPLLFFSLVAGILPWIDSFVLGYFNDIKTVGIYNVAVPLAMLLNFAGEILTQLFFPLITREYSKSNINLIKETSKQVVKWVFIINLPVLIIMLLFPGTIINFFFGADYISAENSLRILSIGVFFSALFMVSDILIAISGRSKLNLMNIVISSVLNLILNLILVPKFGMIGAAISTTISFIVWSSLRGIQAYYYLSIFPFRRKIFRILIVLIIPTIGLFYIRNYVPINTFSLIIIGGLFSLSYFLLLVLTRCLDKNDFMILRSIKKKIFAGYFKKIEI